MQESMETSGGNLSERVEEAVLGQGPSGRSLKAPEWLDLQHRNYNLCHHSISFRYPLEGNIAAGYIIGVRYYCQV